MCLMAMPALSAVLGRRGLRGSRPDLSKALTTVTRPVRAGQARPRGHHQAGRDAWTGPQGKLSPRHLSYRNEEPAG